MDPAPLERRSLFAVPCDANTTETANPPTFSQQPRNPRHSMTKTPAPPVGAAGRTATGRQGPSQLGKVPPPPPPPPRKRPPLPRAKQTAAQRRALPLASLRRPSRPNPHREAARAAALPRSRSNPLASPWHQRFHAGRSATPACPSRLVSTLTCQLLRLLPCAPC